MKISRSLRPPRMPDYEYYLAFNSDATARSHLLLDLPVRSFPLLESPLQLDPIPIAPSIRVVAQSTYRLLHSRFVPKLDPLLYQASRLADLHRLGLRQKEKLPIGPNVPG